MTKYIRATKIPGIMKSGVTTEMSIQIVSAEKAAC